MIAFRAAWSVTIVLACCSNVRAQVQKPELPADVLLVPAEDPPETLYAQAIAVAHVRILGGHAVAKHVAGGRGAIPIVVTEHDARVLEVLKGMEGVRSGETMVIEQPGGTADFGDHLVRMGGFTLLHPGKEYVLFLQEDAATGHLIVQNPGHVYELTTGKVKTEFRSTVNGEAAASVLARLRALRRGKDGPLR